MPSSQLKRLKSSLREQGIVGPQQSKKQKKNGANAAMKDKRVQRNVALQNIREQFNPFEVKAPARGRKFDYTTSRSIGGESATGVKGRPGVTKGLGEENVRYKRLLLNAESSADDVLLGQRKRTLLIEMRRRNKVGGLMDRRFGENDPTMTPEEKMLERFTQEKQRNFKSGSMFDLENDDEEGQLTHFGKSLSFDEAQAVDDFDEGDLGVSDQDDHLSDNEDSLRKRKRTTEDDIDGEVSDNEEEDQPERKKTKAEVMKEVIAKSKMHKYERQQAKEDDDDVREALDKELPSLFALLRGQQRPPRPPRTQASTTDEAIMNPDRAALLSISEKSKAEKKYDERLRQMAFDKRSQPTEPTKTEEERIEQEAKRLQDLEDRRIRRMKGVDESSDEDELRAQTVEGDEDFDPNDAEDFGLGAGIVGRPDRKQLDVEDEDDFIIEQDLVASGSDVDLSESDGSESRSGEEADAAEEDEDDEFIRDLLADDEIGKTQFDIAASSKVEATTANGDRDLAYTYPCPETHSEFIAITKDVPILELPIVVQRIRALYHPKLHSDNKAKLAVFSGILIEHIAYLIEQRPRVPFSIFETLIRHIHSLAKTYAEEIGRAFRSQIQDFQSHPTLATPGDLLALTAIGSIFSTSDHFHQVATPAMLSMTRYLSQKIPQGVDELAIGTYMETLCLHYQRFSKRYIPELVNYTLNTLCIISPSKPNAIPKNFPYHEPVASIRIQDAADVEETSLGFFDIVPTLESSGGLPFEKLKVALLGTQITLIDAMIQMWASKPAFTEIFQPILYVLQHILRKDCLPKLPRSIKDKLQRTSDKLRLLLSQAHQSRRPLALHNHRPLAIKTSIPKFEESYNPDKHYDADRERADSSKLRAEHKRERKGALRELRKDANFIARENLREKKERDREYDKKYKRLVAEIQGEEGREANIYEREKSLRKKGKR
ncbi:MAG: nucleolar complex protein 14 [Pycnora praestabilis]|nr:MAG: nucleolar complex protein 14 [Pycnora praestabilis]